MDNTLQYAQDSTVNKLKLLFLLDKMEIPLTENNIIDICTSRNNWINYMDCKEILWQLMEVGFIYKTQDDDNECRYGITIDGRNCLSHFFLRIPQSLREEISQFINENKMNLKRSQEYVAEYLKNPDGSHTVTLKIKEPVLTSPLLEIKLKAPTRHSAIIACNKWKENAATIFEYLYDTMIENNNDNN